MSPKRHGAVLSSRRTSPGFRRLAAFAGCLEAGLHAQNAEPAPKLTPAEQAAVEQNPVLKEQYLRLARVQELLLAEARKADWEKQPEVQLLMERAHEKALAESWLKRFRSAAGVSLGGRTDHCMGRAQAAFATPRQHLLAQIFIACPKGADKAAVAKADAKLAAVRKRLASADEDFATIAGTESEDQAAPRAAAKSAGSATRKSSPNSAPLSCAC